MIIIRLCLKIVYMKQMRVLKRELNNQTTSICMYMSVAVHRGFVLLLRHKCGYLMVAPT